MNFKVTENIKKNIASGVNKYRDVLYKAGERILDGIAIIATSKYIRSVKAVFTKTGKISMANPKPLPDKLTSRTGNLVRSLLGARNFKGTGEGIEEQIREIEITSKRMRLALGTKLRSRQGFDYPKLHEYGGKKHRPRPFLTPAFRDGLRTSEAKLQKLIDSLVINV